MLLFVEKRVLVQAINKYYFQKPFTIYTFSIRIITMNKISFLSIFVFLLFSSSMVLADVQIPEEFEDDTHRLLTALGIVGNARINVIDEKNDSVYGVTVVNSKVEEIKFSPVENPNYVIEFSAIAYDAILNAKDPEQEFLHQLKIENIKIKPQDFIATATWLAIQIILFFNEFLHWL